MIIFYSFRLMVFLSQVADCLVYPGSDAGALLIKRKGFLERIVGDRGDYLKIKLSKMIDRVEGVNKDVRDKLTIVYLTLYETYGLRIVDIVHSAKPDAEDDTDQEGDIDNGIDNGAESGTDNNTGKLVGRDADYNSSSGRR